MNFVAALALDEFGAEALGYAARTLDEITTGRQALLCLWGGAGKAPEDSTLLERRFPAWDGGLESLGSLANEGLGLDLDRTERAQEVARAIAGDTGRAQLKRLLRELPLARVGNNQPFTATLLLLGSLARAETSGTVLGVLSGISRLKRLGLHSEICRAVLGTGAASGSGGAEERIRALVARGLLDLQSFFVAAEHAAERAAGVLLVGEDQDGAPEASRRTQVALAGLATVGLTISLAQGGQETADVSFDPFRFSIDSDGRVHLANDRFVCDHPFSVVGGYLVHSPSRRLAELVSARVCELGFDLLARDRGFGSIEDAAREPVAGAREALLRATEAASVAGLWETVTRPTRPLAAPTEAEEAKGAWCDLSAVRHFLASVLAERDWERLIDAYGEARLRAIPLEDWGTALDELQEGIEAGIVPRRIRHVNALLRRAATSYLDQTDRAIARIFGSSFDDAVHAAPRRTAQLLLGRFYRQLFAARQSMEQLRPLRRTSSDRSPRRGRLEQLRRDLEQTLREVPSPIAVFFRFIPLVVLVTLLSLVLPIDLGPLDGLRQRSLVGLGAGVLGALAFFVAKVEAVRRRLLRSYREWIALYKVVLGDEDDSRRGEAAVQLIDLLLDCTRWKFSGTSEDPPLPEGIRVHLEPASKQAVEAPARPDLLRPQQVLGGFDKLMESARAAFAGFGQFLLARYQPALVETALPELPPEQASALEREVDRVLPNTEGARDDRLRAFFQSLARRAREPEAAPGKVFVVPFAAAGAPEETSRVEPVWRRAFGSPADESLEAEPTALRSPGLLLFESARELVEVSAPADATLSARVREAIEFEGAHSASESQLFRRYANLAKPSARVNGGRTGRVILAWGPEDSLAKNFDAVNSLGGGQASIHFLATVGVSAEETIFVPNREAPQTSLGRSWAAFDRAPTREPALRPVTPLPDPTP